MIKFSASLMCANALDLRKDLLLLDKAGIDLFHIDIMGGNFVPNLAMNFATLSSIQEISKTPFDIHLMVHNPGDYVSMIDGLNVKYISFHIETEKNPIRLLRSFKKKGIKAGVAYNPATPIDGLEYYADEADYVLLMSVEPGFAGQCFLPSVYEKIRKVRSAYNKLKIQIDGNINVSNAKECIACGADNLVCGTSSIFKKDMSLFVTFSDFREKIYSGTNYKENECHAISPM